VRAATGFEVETLVIVPTTARGTSLSVLYILPIKERITIPGLIASPFLLAVFEVAGRLEFS
jgi:hypothetical protein